MQGVLVKKEAFSVVGIAKKGSHTIPSDSGLIASLWNEMTKRRDEVKYRTFPSLLTGICIPPASNDYFYIAGVETDSTDLPKGMELFHFPAYNYLKYLHKGSARTLFETYGKIWGEWFPASGYSLVKDGPELEIVDVEKYPDPYTEDYEMEIYIPIEIG